MKTPNMRRKEEDCRRPRKIVGSRGNWSAEIKSQGRTATVRSVTIKINKPKESKRVQKSPKEQATWGDAKSPQTQNALQSLELPEVFAELLRALGDVVQDQSHGKNLENSNESLFGSHLIPFQTSWYWHSICRQEHWQNVQFAQNAFDDAGKGSPSGKSGCMVLGLCSKIAVSMKNDPRCFWDIFQKKFLLGRSLSVGCFYFWTGVVSSRILTWFESDLSWRQMAPS